MNDINYKKNIDYEKNVECVKVLIENPEFIGAYYGRVHNLLCEDWVDILKVQPTLIDKCPKLKEFRIYDWVSVLISQPSLAEKCNRFEGFYEDDWSRLVKNVPSFKSLAEKYKRGKIALIIIKEATLSDYESELNQFTPYDWERILKERPEIFEELKNFGSPLKYLLLKGLIDEKECDVTKFSTEDWVEVLKTNFNMHPLCKCYGDFNSEQWERLFSGRYGGKFQKFIGCSLKKAEDYIRENWDFFENDGNYFFYGFSNWSSLNEYHWIRLLNEFNLITNLMKRYRYGRIALFLTGRLDEPFDDWESIHSYNKISLLKGHPEYVDKISLDGNIYDWCNIFYTGCGYRLSANDKLDLDSVFVKLAKKTTSGWAFLLRAMPELAKECDCWDKFRGVEWSFIFVNNPEFVDKCPMWEEMKNTPLFAESEYGDAMYASTLEDDGIRGTSDHPQYSSGEDFVEDVASDDVLLFKQKSFIDNYDKWDSFSERAWSYILIAYPHLIEKAKEYKNAELAVATFYNKRKSNMGNVAK